MVEKWQSQVHQSLSESSLICSETEDTPELERIGIRLEKSMLKLFEIDKEWDFAVLCCKGLANSTLHCKAPLQCFPARQSEEKGPAPEGGTWDL